VSMAPGATALTRISGARSMAAERTHPSSAAFVVAYAVMPPVVARPCTLPMTTTEPSLAARLSRVPETSASTAMTLTLRAFAHSSQGVSPAPPSGCTAPLWTTAFSS